jgi:hypothetical protein
MLDLAADRNLLHPSPPTTYHLPPTAYRRMPYQKHYNLSELSQPIFEHPKYPDLAEPLREIVRLTKVLLETIP